MMKFVDKMSSRQFDSWNWKQVLTDLRPPIHTETFSCVFVLFQVMSWLFSIPLRTVNNTKTQENVSVCTRPKSKAI